MTTILVFTEVGHFVVEVFEYVVGVMGGGWVTFLVWRSREVERFAFEVFDPIRGLGCGGSG